MAQRMLAVGLMMALGGCGPVQGAGGHGGGSAGGGTTGAGDMAGETGGGGGTAGGGGGTAGGGGVSGNDCVTTPGACYTVYAHSNTTLYSINLMTKTLVTIGDFKPPTTDTMTDLAVAPDNTIYTVSKTKLYTADPNDGHVTLVGTISTCGTDNVALSTTDDGKLWVGDGKGAFCEIDLSGGTPAVTSIGTLGKSTKGSWALSGDLVGIGNGTLFGTVLDTGDTTTTSNNQLATIDPKTGAIIKNLGNTGFPQLYGIAYALGQVFGFTHDGSGRVITIDPATGVGTLFNTFNDPTTGKPISFSGAGVNSKVAPIS